MPGAGDVVKPKVARGFAKAHTADACTHRIAELRRELQSGPHNALAIVDEIAAHPDSFVQNFGAIRKAFVNARRTDLFLQALLDMPPSRLRYLPVIASILRLAARDDAAPSYSSVAAALESRGCLDKVRFRTSDYLAQYQERGSVGMDVLTRCKYGRDISDLGFGNLLEHVRPAVVVPEGLSRALHAISRSYVGSEKAWREDLCTAFAADHVARDWSFLAAYAAQKKPFLQAATNLREVEQFFLKLKNPKGLLLLTFHSGFQTAAQRMYGRYGVDSISLGLLKTGKDGPGAGADPSGALFAALKHLAKGGMVLIAPDAKQGTNISSVDVLGGEFPVGHGAAFLAFETGCDTGWYTAELREDRLVPVFCAGPRREGGEKFELFKERLLDFYAHQISNHLTGDPKNLALRSCWLKFFSAESKELSDRSA